MPYYGAGDYYGRGGLLDVLKKGVSTVARGAVGFVTGGPAGAISSVASALLPQTRTPQPPQFRVPSATVTPSAFLPGGTPLISFGRRRRRMNYANGRALTRANRRVDGFVRMARKSLQHTGYKIVSKSAGKGKRPTTINVETGPGGIRG